MASKISNVVFACVILLVVRNSVTKTLVPKCDYECKTKDLETGGDYFASGSAISSQFLMPDGSVVTNSKETSISSDGIKQTFHELKKEADRFVQTGHGGPNIQLPAFGNIPNFGIPSIPKLTVPVVPVVPYYPSGQQNVGSNINYGQSQSTSNQYGQSQHAAEHVHSNQLIPCDICAVNTGSLNSENTASYNTIVGNVPPASEAHSIHQKYESSASAQKNSTYQTQPVAVPFSNSLKPNTFTTNFIDLGSANRHFDTGVGSESQINYQEQGSSRVRSEERVVGQPAYAGGPVAYPSRVVVSVGGPSAVNSHVYEKQQSSSHVQTAQQNPAAVVLPAAALAQQAEAELSRQHQSNVFRSPVLLGGEPQPVPVDQHAGSYQSSHSSFYSSSSSSSSGSKSVGTDLSAGVVHQIPQKLSAGNGYSSSSSSSSSSSYSQNAPEVYYNGNKIHGASSSIYDQQLRGDQIRGNANAETLCHTCTYVAGTPVKNSYGVATSYSSQSSTINGKTTENREAAVAVNDNGKVDRYHVKT